MSAKGHKESGARSAQKARPSGRAFLRLGQKFSGELPCHKVYEDDMVFAFLDINPWSPCHTLVVPKEPAVTLDALSSESSAAIGAVLPKIAKAVLAVSGAKDFNVLQNNGAEAYQSVFHVHFLQQYSLITR